MNNKIYISVLLVFMILPVFDSGLFASLSKPPEDPDRSGFYLFYLHGLIIENGGKRAHHLVHGYYEYEEILKVLKNRGFVVISEARKRGTKVFEYADKIAGQIRSLLKKKVRADHIIVVGASKGGIIAANISNILKNRDMNYVILAGLFKQILKDKGLQLFGNVLSVHDSSDRAPIVPGEFFKRSKGLGKHKQIVTNLQLGHGLLFKPYPQWVNPLVEWSGINNKGD
ncbi:MAG: hypothetical protein ABFR36_07585 [Acidobacteriota bacterium]